MPLYDFKCRKCGREKTIYCSMDSIIDKKVECGCLSVMTRQFSSPQISMNNTLGSWMDKNAHTRPKEWFKKQRNKETRDDFS